MKRFIALIVLFASTRVIAFSPLKTNVTSIEFKYDIINFKLEIKNNSRSNVVLSSIQKTACYFQDDVLYVGYFARPFYFYTGRLEEYHDSNDYYVLKPHEKIIINEHCKLDCNNKLLESRLKKIDVFIGYIEPQDILKEDYSCDRLFFMQKIDGFKDIKSFSLNSLNAKAVYIFKNLKKAKFRMFGRLYVNVLLDSLEDKSDSMNPYAVFYPKLSKENFNRFIKSMSQVTKAVNLEKETDVYIFDQIVYMYLILKLHKLDFKCSFDYFLLEQLCDLLLIKITEAESKKLLDDLKLENYKIAILGKEYFKNME